MKIGPEASDDEVRAWLESHGWEASGASFYDEEGVEGWVWTHPDVDREFGAIGGWDEPAAIGDDLREYVAATSAA